MTILEAVANVAAEAGYEVDTTVIGSTDPTTRQLLAIANKVIKKMAKAYPWSALFTSGSITLADGTASYALPSAFSHYHYDTFWNQSTRWRLRGPMTEQEYADAQGFGLSADYIQSFQVRGVTNNRLTIYPTPGADEDAQVIIFEYAADRPVRPPTWTTGDTITAGDYRFYNGVYYTASSSGTTTGSTGPSGDGGVTWATYTGAYSDFQSDGDEPVLSQDVLEQGMLERFAEIHGIESINRTFLVDLNEEFSRDAVGQVIYADSRHAAGMWGRSNKVVFGG